jgi:hypothetical protein
VAFVNSVPQSHFAQIARYPPRALTVGVVERVGPHIKQRRNHVRLGAHETKVCSATKSERGNRALEKTCGNGQPENEYSRKHGERRIVAAAGGYCPECGHPVGAVKGGCRIRAPQRLEVVDEKTGRHKVRSEAVNKLGSHLDIQQH